MYFVCAAGSSEYYIWCWPRSHTSKHPFVPARLGNGGD